MQPDRPATHLLSRALPFALLLVMAPPATAHVTGFEVPAPDLLALIEESPDPAWRPEADPCACLAQLRGCLMAATISLGQCIATLPVDVLCYVKFELDVLLCLQQAETCASTCVP